MNILDIKQLIKAEIDRTDEEELLEEILQLLRGNVHEIPEWHKQILEERLKKYENREEELLDWEDVKKDL